MWIAVALTVGTALGLFLGRVWLACQITPHLRGIARKGYPSANTIKGLEAAGSATGKWTAIVTKKVMR